MRVFVSLPVVITYITFLRSRRHFRLTGLRRPPTLTELKNTITSPLRMTTKLNSNPVACCHKLTSSDNKLAQAPNPPTLGFTGKTLKSLAIICFGVLAILMASLPSFAQTTYTWASTTAGGSWATGSNWSPTRSSPANNDVLVFNASSNITITAIPTQTIGRLRVIGSGVVTLQSSGNITLTIQAGGTSPQVDIAAGGIIVNGITSNTINLSVANGNTISTATGTSLAFTNLATFTNNGVTFTQNGVLFDFQSGSAYTHAVNQGTIPIGTWNANSTVSLTSMTNGNGSGLANIANINQAFGNLTVGCSQTTDLSLNVNSSFSVAGTFLVTGNTTGSAGTQYNGNGTRYALKLVSSVSSGSVTITLNNVTVSGSTNVCLVVFSDAPASSSNTVTVNVTGTITLGNNSNQARLIYVGNTAPATITCTGTALTNIGNNSTLVFLDHGNLLSGCNVTVTMLSSISTSTSSSQFWPLRAYANSASNGSNNSTLNVTIGNFTTPCTITNQGTSGFNILAQNSGSAANQSNNQVTFTVYGNVVQNSGTPTITVNPTDRSDASRQVATLNIYQTTGGVNGNLTISSGNFIMGQNNNVLASNGNRSFLNVEGNISGGTITGGSNRVNMVGQVRLFGPASRLATTGTLNLNNAIDLIIDNGTGNSSTLDNTVNLNSGISYLKLTSGNLNLNAKTCSVAANTWVFKSQGTISATPSYTAPINYYYSGTTTTGPELSTSFNAGTIVVASSANITSGGNFRFQTRFVNKGTFTQSTSFTATSVNSVTLTDSAGVGTSATFGNLASVNTGGSGNWINDLSFTVAGNWTSSVTSGDLALLFIKGNTVTPRTVNVVGNFTIGAGTRFDMTSSSSPTLTSNGPDHSLIIGGNFTYNNGNDICKFVYINGNFIQAVNLTIGGTGSSAFNVSSITSIDRFTLKNLAFTGTGSVSSTSVNCYIYGSLSNTSTTNLNISGGRINFMGGPYGFTQNIGSSGGGTLSLPNVTIEASGTVVSMLQNISISGTGTSDLWHSCAFGINSAGTNPVFRTNSFNLTFNATSNSVIFVLPALTSFNAGTGTVTFDVPTGVTAQLNFGVNFNNVVMTSSGGTVSNGNAYNYTIGGDITVNSTFNLANNSATTTFNKAGTQLISGSTGAINLRTVVISSGTTVNATFANNITVAGSFTNNGTFNQTAGTFATDNVSGVTDSRSSNNSTFFNLAFYGNGQVCLWDMSCTITNNLSFGSAGSGCTVQMAIAGTPDYITTKNIFFNNGNNGYGIDYGAGGRTLAANLSHTLEVSGSITHNSSSYANFVCFYTNSGFVNALNVLLKSTTATNSIDLSANNFNCYLNNLTVDASSQFPITGLIDARLYGTINNASNNDFTLTNGRISSYRTGATITNSGSGLLQVFNLSNTTGTLNIAGAVRSAGTGTGTNNFQGAIDIQSGSTLALGSSTFTTIGAGATYRFAGTLSAGTSTWIFANTGTPDFRTDNNVTFNNVTLALNGPSSVTLSRDNRIYTFSGTVEASTFQFTATSGNNSAFYVVNGLFRTANLNGLNTNSSSSISTTNFGSLTLGTGSTIEYNASTGTQTVSALTNGYYALNLTNGGTKQAAGSFNIQGGSSMNINAGVSFDAATFTLGRTGSGTANYLINGTFQTGNANGFNAATGSISTSNTAITQGASSVIEYTGLVAQSVTSITSPNQNYINLRLSNNIGLSMGTSTVVETSLTLNGGSLTLGNNDLTLGTSPGNLGALTVNSGLLATTGTGRFVRWFGTSGLPTSTATGVRFPVGTTSSDRSIYLAFSSASALSSGGTIGVNHSLANGISAVGSPFADGTGGDLVSITFRTNAGWNFSTPSAPTLSGGESIFVEARGSNIAAITTSSQARFVNVPGPAAGTSVNGAGTVTSPIAFRSGLSLANLTNAAWCIGAPTMQAVIVAVNGTAANWATASTWSSSTVPTSTDYVVIPSSAAVVNLSGGAPYECLTLQVDQGANLNLSTNTLVPASGGAVNIFGTTTTQNTNGIALSPSASISSTNSPTISFGNTGTANYNGTGAQTISGIQYNNLTISAARSGSPTITLDGTNTIGLTGALSITATGVGSYANTGNTINFNGSLTQTIPAFIGYNNLTSSNTGARILASSGNIDITGIFNPGTNTYTVAGSTVRFVGSSAQTIPAFNFQNLTSTSTGTRVLASTGNIGIAGTFTPGTNAYTNTGSTVIYNGTGTQTVATFNYNNLTVNGGRGSNTVTMGATVGVAGALALNSTVTYNFTTNNSVTNYNGVGNVSQTVIGGTYFTYNNLTISASLTGANTVTMDPVNRIQARAFNPVASPGGAGYIVTGSHIQLTVSGTTIPSFVYNNLTSSNNAHTLPSSGTIEILGTWVANNCNFTPSTSTVKFSSASNVSLPDAGPYYNLQITGAGIKSMSRVHIVNNELTLDNSYLSMDAGQGIEIGTSAANPGALSVVGAAGIINNQGNNSAACYILRWFGTSALPTTFSNAGLFPVVRRYNNILSSRYLYLNYSSATALSTGGSVRVTYNNGSGVSQEGSVPFTQFADNSGPTVNLVRGAAYRWVITTPSTPILAGGQSIGLKLENAGSMRVSIPANTRAINFVTGSGVFQQGPGTSQAGGGTQTDPTCSKSGLTIANLTANNWLLATDKLVGQVVASGVWSNTGIWLGGNIPGTTDDVFIPAPYDVSLVSNITLNSLDVNSGASLNTNNNVITLGAAQTLTVNGSIKVATPTLNQANNSALSTTNAPILVLGPNSTVEYASSGSQTIDNLNYANLTMSNTGGRTFNGNVGVSGSLNLNGTNAFTTTGSTIDFNGTTAITVPGFTYNNLTISGNKAANNVTFSGIVSMTGSFSPSATFSSGGYVVTGSTFEFTGTGASTVPAFTYNNLTLSDNRGSNNITLAGASTILGTFSPIATFGAGNYVTTGNTLTFDGTAAQTVPAFNYNNLAITGSRTSNNVTLVGAINIVGSFSPSASFAGGNYVVTGSTIGFNGTSAQSIPSFTYNNLTVSGARGSNNITLASGTMNVAGDFVNSATFGAGTWVNTGNTVDMTGAGSQALPGGGIILNNLSNSGNGNRTWAASTLNLQGTFSPGSGTYTAPVGSTLNYAGGNGQTIQPVNYYALSSSNNSRVLSASGTIDIAQNFTPGSGAYTANGSTVRFSGGNANVGGISGGYQNVMIETSGSKTLTSPATMLDNSTLALNAGVLNNSSFGISLGNGATITRTTGSLSTAPTFGTSANVTYLAGLSTGPELPTSSSVLQTLTINPGIGNAVTLVTGTNPTVNTNLSLVDGKLAIGTNTLTIAASMSGSGNISGDATSNLTISGTTGLNIGNLAFGPSSGDRQLNNLSINRNGGNCALTLGTNLGVAGTLAFAPTSTCNIQTGANILDLGSTGIVTGEANGRYVVGNLSVNRTLNTGSNSFGNVGASMYCTNCNLGSTSVVRKSGSGTSVLSSLGTRSINRTYDIVPTSQPAIHVNLRLSWISDDNYYNTPATNGRVWRSTDNGTTWTKVGTMQNFNNGYMDVLADHFSEWTVADANNPLPLELVSFSGSWFGNAVRLNWSTISESNTSHFEVERSQDMVSYERIGTVKAAGNSTNLLAYHHDDKTAKVSKLYYYRLKQVDADEQFTYSSVIRLNTGEGGTFSVYPNPATGHVSVTLPSDAIGAYQITITDAVGNVVKTVTIHNILGATTTALDLSGISQGIYVVSVSGPSMYATVNQKLEIR